MQGTPDAGQDQKGATGGSRELPALGKILLLGLRADTTASLSTFHFTKTLLSTPPILLFPTLVYLSKANPRCPIPNNISNLTQIQLHLILKFLVLYSMYKLCQILHSEQDVQSS